MGHTLLLVATIIMHRRRAARVWHALDLQASIGRPEHDNSDDNITFEHGVHKPGAASQ